MTTFIIGVFLGVSIGVFGMCLMMINRDEEEYKR